jgi:hypothetical protein
MAQATGGTGGESKFRDTTSGGSISKLSESIDGVDPYVQVTYRSASQGSGGTTITERTTVSGATSDTLTLRADTVKNQTVNCVVSGASIPTNPTTVTSSTVNFYTISQSNLQTSLVNLESLDDLNSSVFTTLSQNLYQNPLTINPGTGQSLYTWVLYSAENIPVRITLTGAGGRGFNGFVGGRGGQTIFTYTLKANTEYIFKLGRTEGIAQSTGGGGPGAFFYEKGKLLVVSGGGGASGSGADGGDGGGAGIPGTPGQAGSGPGAGTGGLGVLTGQLPAAGLLPNGRNGGKVESCTTGFYWKNQGIAPCVDIGSSKFYDANGNIVSGSATITRGYKADREYIVGNYGYRFNGGNSSTLNTSGVFVGGGGSGVYGGAASLNGIGGGGGGAGYSDGSVNIISTGVGDSVASGLFPFPANARIELLV